MSWYDDMVALLGGTMSEEELEEGKVIMNNMLLDMDYEAGTNSHSPEEFMGYDD